MDLLSSFPLVKDTVKSLSKSCQTEHYRAEIVYDIKAHHTHLYDTRIMVIRRGTSLEIHLDELKAEGDELRSIFVRLTVLESGTPVVFDIKIGESCDYGYSLRHKVKDSKKSFSMIVDLSEKVPVGYYNASVYINDQKIADNMNFLVIFNPFNKDDQVYIENKEWQKEYVLNPETIIYFGTYSKYHSNSYELDQFSLECCLVIIHLLSSIPLNERSDPVLISRAFSALCNSNDDNGIVVAKFGIVDDGDGMPPLSWRRANEIYSEYLKTSMSVRYGQSHIFALILGSTLRCLGFGNRLSTGYSIAHDKNLDGICRVCLDEETMEVIPGSETHWNYHVWVDVILNRNDVSFFENNKKYSKFNMLDGTPQERSEGIYCCGPYPLELLKRGIHDKNINYDGHYLHSALNSKFVYSIINKKGEVVSETEGKPAAPLILTKGINSIGPQDVTYEYKPITEFLDKVNKKKKIKISISTPSFHYLTDPFIYHVSVHGCSPDATTLVKVVVVLENNYGKNMLGHSLVDKITMFETSDFEDTVIQILAINKELTLESLLELKTTVYCYDKQMNEIAVKESLSRLSFLKCSLECIDFISYKDPLYAHISITNMLSTMLKSLRILVETSDGDFCEYVSIDLLKPKETLKFDLKVNFKSRGFKRINARVIAENFYEKIGTERVLAY